MKFLSNYIKEMKIAFRGFYIYIEVGFALVLLFLLLLVIPENFNSTQKEFVYYDMNSVQAEAIINQNIESGLITKGEEKVFTVKSKEIEIKDLETNKIESKTIEKEEIKSTSYESENKIVYKTNSLEDLIALSSSKKYIGTVIKLSDGVLSKTYYTQGYETDKYNNLLYLSSSNIIGDFKEIYDSQEIKIIGNSERLSDRENIVPIFLTFSCSLMGFFIILSYMFLDKDEGTIKALAVTPISIIEYLLSKLAVLMTTALITGLLIVFPTLLFTPNYLVLIPFLLASTFFSGTIGLLIGTFYKDIMSSFGVLYTLMVAFMVPMITYYIPGFNAIWIKFLPTYPMLEGYKEAIIKNGDITYVLMYTLIFIVLGTILLLISNKRYKKELTV